MRCRPTNHLRNLVATRAGSSVSATDLRGGAQVVSLASRCTKAETRRGILVNEGEILVGTGAGILIASGLQEELLTLIIAHFAARKSFVMQLTHVGVVSRTRHLMQDLVAWTAHNGDFRVAVMSSRIVVTRARGRSAFVRVDEGAQTEVILLMLVNIAGNGIL